MMVLKALIFVVSLIALPAAFLMIPVFLTIDIARNVQIREENNEN